MTKRMEQVLDSAAEHLANLVKAEKVKWMDGQMARIMPPDLYALAQTASTKAKDRKKLIKWLETNQVLTFEQRGDGCGADRVDRTLLGMKNKPVSEFLIRFRDGKPECLSKDFPV